MQIKELFIDEKQYQQWFQSLLDVAANINASLWREEDKEKLEPFFQWNAQYTGGKAFATTMTAEEKASFEHYKRCSEAYANAASEKRDALRQFCFEDLCDIFGFELVDPDNDESDAIQLSPNFSYEFPLVVVGYLESDYHRGSPDKLAAISMFSLKEFNLVVDEEPQLDHDLLPVKNYNEDRDE